MKLLVHVCCGPCAIIPFKELLSKEWQVWGLFYNPNIHPYHEYVRRLEAVKRLQSLLDLRIIYSDDYDMEGFIAHVAHDISNRCHYCYRMRLERTALEAKKRGFDAFSTSLLYSKYQDHDLIKRFGEEIGRTQGIRFFYHDFRKGWGRGIKLSRKMGLYRQRYCGCIYSARERSCEGGSK